MYGLINKMKAQAGKRDELLKLMLGGVDGMPGCLSYVVAVDPADADAIWITEVWDNAENHKASLSIPAVKAVIAQAMPLIAGFETSITTEPVGGVGLGA